MYIRHNRDTTATTTHGSRSLFFFLPRSVYRISFGNSRISRGASRDRIPLLDVTYCMVDVCVRVCTYAYLGMLVCLSTRADRREDWLHFYRTTAAILSFLLFLLKSFMRFPMFLSDAIVQRYLSSRRRIENVLFKYDSIITCL